MMNDIKEYEYSSSWFILFIGCIMFGGCTVLFYFKARYNFKGLLINNIFELSVNNASLFYWVFFVLSLLMTLISILGIYFKVKEKKYLIINEFKIVIPPVGFQKKITEISFAKLSGINETKVNGNYILTLYFENQQKNIVSSLLSSKNEYKEIKRLIISKIEL